MGYLSRAFHASEESNRRAILRALPARRGVGVTVDDLHEGLMREDAVAELPREA